ncbi:hypothetical protein CTAYLR_005274 [Chrysophaeum taylorii]|uniref:UBC core domain-containing protein n=1 Tax=Chrysophaeum taylorii TaxID=2483200 RepID=A0AAD7UJ75_9STRA|nr:hypothetical protein CTAYLR_005274 [Chrysophaeum taylorii]
MDEDEERCPDIIEEEEDGRFDEEEEEEDEEYEYADSEEERAVVLLPRKIAVDIESTKKRVGATKAYQWQKEWNEVAYPGYQDEENPLVFHVNVWQDYFAEVVLDEKHPSRPPKFGAVIPQMDSETTLMLSRMECLDPKKWNFCTKLNNLLRYAEDVLRRATPTETWRPLEQALYDLGVLLDAQPKCIETISRENLPQLPKFGEAEDEDKAAKKRKLAALGWSSGTGYGTGSINAPTLAAPGAAIVAAPPANVVTAAAPPPPAETSSSSSSGASSSSTCSGTMPETSAQQSKAETTNRKLGEILETIHEHMGASDLDYVKETSTWQLAIQPFVRSASLFDFEKYEDIFDKIERVATRIGDDATLKLLRRRQPDENARATDDDSGGGVRTTGVSVKTPYQKMLAREHVVQCEMTVPTKAIPGAQGAHGQHRTAPSAPPSARLIRRAAREFHTLLDGLPLEDDTAVFARHNANNLLHFKLMIVPSKETPYAFGCYVFSVMLPHNYPESPPAVLFETTGNGTVRFNPNLYQNGKVCLSLIGTWPGRREEQWDAQNSNLLALALSIQALIFTNEPYFNEPGYEAKRGTPEGDQLKHRYNATVRQNNKRVAIEEQYKNPPPEFASVIRQHIDFHRPAIDVAFADVGVSAAASSSRPGPAPDALFVGVPEDEDDDDET